MSRFATLFASLVVAAAPTAARAQMRMHETGMRPMGELRMYLQAAELTPDQKTKVHEMQKSNWEQVRPLMQQLRAVRVQIADKLASPGAVAASDLAPLQQQVASLRGQIESDFVQTALQIRALLTVDQLGKVSQTYQKMKTLREEMRELVTPPAEAAPVEKAPAKAPAAGPALGQD